MEKFGERLKRIREKRRLTQGQLAELAKVPYETIYRVERGTHHEPRFSVVIRLALALGVSLDVLAGLYSEDEELPAATELVAP